MTDWLAIERAGLCAWPALVTERYDGWILRYARGYTRRANSINPLCTSTLPLATKADYCVHRYRAEGLAPVWRIVDRGPALAVDAWLDREGWVQRDETLVLWRTPNVADAEPSSLAGLEASELGPWVQAYARITGDGCDQRTHKDILHRVRHCSVRLTVVRDRRPVACTLAVMGNGLLSILDVAVEPAWRRRGLATALLLQALRWGAAQGARGAILSVLGTNVPARALYAKLGFASVYAYWYREWPAGDAA